MNKSEAIRATNNGAIAACISAVTTIIIVITAISSDGKELLSVFNDSFYFVDAAIMLAFAFGIYKKSRAASVVMFLYYLLSKIVIYFDVHEFGGLGIGISLLFLYLYGKAVKGSFAYHKLEKEENPLYKATTKWTYIAGFPAFIMIVVIIGFSLMEALGVVPSTRVLASSEVKDRDISTLESQGIIASSEKVVYFYSQGVSSILESGNILTTNRVIFYFSDENERLKIYSIPINDVANVVLESQGDKFNDSVYKVNSKDSARWLKLFLSVEQNGDKKFVKALQNPQELQFFQSLHELQIRSMK